MAEKPKKKLWRLAVLAVGLLALAVGFGIYAYRISGIVDGDLFEPLVHGGFLAPGFPAASSKPDPFAELTIPYLQARVYESKLDRLDQLAETATYTSYLTGYDSDGLRVNGLLTMPKGNPSTGSGQGGPAGGWPAVVLVHGYIPPSQYRTEASYANYVDFLAERGLVVFKIDLRGHDESEGEPGGSYYSGDYIIDTLNARAALAGTPFVNPGKIGLWGHSMAGNVVFRSLAADPTIQRVVIWAGAVYTYEDMRELGINDNSYRPPGADTERQRKRAELREAHGEFDPNDPFWQQVPATNYLGDMTGSVQIHHAVDDSVVTIGYSRNLIQLLEEAGVEGELFEYSSGGHNLTGETFTTAMQRSADFLRSY